MAKNVSFGRKSVSAESPKINIAERPKAKHNFGRNFGRNRTEILFGCPLLVPGKDVRLSEGPLVHVLDLRVQILGGLVHGGSEGVVGKVQTGVHVADVSDELSLGCMGNVRVKYRIDQG